MLGFDLLKLTICIIFVSFCQAQLNETTNSENSTITSTIKSTTPSLMPTCPKNTQPDPNDPSKCQCKPDRYGPDCNQKPCDLDSVENQQCKHGMCLQQPDTGVSTCKCDAGFSGFLCEIPLCLNYCTNYGKCKVINETDNTRQCKCSHRFFGDRCQFDKCADKVCPVGCYMNNSCKCFCGHLCDTNYCRNNGTCIDNDGQLGCKCKAGYSSPICSIDNCKGYCFNEGDCQRHEHPITHHLNTISCKCPDGFKSDKRCGVKDLLVIKLPINSEVPREVPSDFRSTKIIMYALSMTLFACLASIGGYMAIQRGMFSFLSSGTKGSPSGSSVTASYTRQSTFPFVKNNLNFSKLDEDESVNMNIYSDL